MLPYKTILRLDTKSRTPKYLQITNEFIKHISQGTIAPGQKLPGSRQLSELLAVNRRTIISAYDELAAQGWVSIEPNRGCYVTEKLPLSKPEQLTKVRSIKRENHSTHFSLDYETSDKPIDENYDFVINDGYPDVRLAPLRDLAKNYSYIMNSSISRSVMSYKQKFLGDEVLRQELVKYLAETRSIHVDIDNIMITRGSLAAFHILFKTILQTDDQVAVGYPGFNEGHEAITLAGGQINPIPIDNEGLVVDELEKLCRSKLIRAVFIIPHHHYPTTVSLSAARRMQLLQLAEKFGFAIIEDDYDYDFHYSSSPILPLASTDYLGSVAYVGSLSKTLAPSLRIGFIVAPKKLIEAACHISRAIDSFGNTGMERAVAMLFRDGLIRRHLRKALQTYRERRDHFCALLENELGDYLNFNIPEGGLAIWTQLKRHNLQQLQEAGKVNHINIPNELGFCLSPFESGSMRIGFASMNLKEAQMLIEQLRRSFEYLD
ncbi:MAG: PLP-dependent aminotransferase family protein [Bacteroidota bacterium]